MNARRDALSLYLGAAGIVFITVVWLLTNRIEPALVALFGSMVGVNEGVQALKDVNKKPEPVSPQPLPPPTPQPPESATASGERQ